jgi:hypothetical protein
LTGRLFSFGPCFGPYIGRGRFGPDWTLWHRPGPVLVQHTGCGRAKFGSNQAAQPPSGGEWAVLMGGENGALPRVAARSGLFPLLTAAPDSPPAQESRQTSRRISRWEPPLAWSLRLGLGFHGSPCQSRRDVVQAAKAGVRVRLLVRAAPGGILLGTNSKRLQGRHVRRVLRLGMAPRESRPASCSPSIKSRPLFPKSHLFSATCGLALLDLMRVTAASFEFWERCAFSHLSIF